MCLLAWPLPAYTLITQIINLGIKSNRRYLLRFPRSLFSRNTTYIYNNREPNSISRVVSSTEVDIQLVNADSKSDLDAVYYDAQDGLGPRKQIMATLTPIFDRLLQNHQTATVQLQADIISEKPTNVLPIVVDFSVDEFRYAMDSFLLVFAAFGTAFFAEMVKLEFKKNIDKIIVACEKRSAKSIFQMVTIEKKLKCIGKNSGTEGLVWARRTLRFIGDIMHILMTESSSVRLHDIGKRAFESALKPYQNWFVQQLFENGLKFLPNRYDFFDRLGGCEELVMQQVPDFYNSYDEFVYYLTEYCKVLDIDESKL